MCRWFYLIFLVFQIIFIDKFCVCERIKIGGLFDQESDDALLAFQYAIDAVNNQKDENLLKLEGIMMRVPSDNEYVTSKKLCKILKMGVAAIFGPTAPTSSIHVQSLCDEKELPLLQSFWETERKLPLVNLYPDTRIMEQVTLELIKKFEWKSFTILYETGQWIPRLASLLKLYNPDYSITLSQLSLSSNKIFRQKLRRVKDSEDKHIIIDCSIESLPEILKQAQQVGLITDNYQFIITNFDMHTIDLEPYQYSGTNITGFRMIDPTDLMVKQVVEYWNTINLKKGNDTPRGLTAEGLKINTALIYDSILLFSDAIDQMKGVDQLESLPLQCDDTETFKHGYSIINYMKTSVVRGLTKNIKFDNGGFRRNFDLELIELASAGIRKIGTWNENHKLEIDRGFLKSASNFDDVSMKNVTLKVLTAISPPYGMLKQAAQTLNGNDRFEGFGIELIEKLSEMLGFNYTFSLQEDGAYGSYNKKTKTWNGMMREVMDGRFDLAITDLTITSERESAVDFTMPFMNLGISILFRKPTKQAPSLFSFMSPFSNEVWMYLGGSYLGVSLCLFILGRISPKEWDNPYPCNEEPEELENQFSISNSLWFTVGALLQQGTELAPKTPSTRTIASIWWFFTLIMVSSYTANLAAFLTVEPISSQIGNAKDLANSEGKIQYGAKEGGSTISFFKDADVPTYQKMSKYMTENPQYLTNSNDEGLDRVKKDNYAFLMESTSIEYLVERHCEVTQIGGLLDDKGYGIAMQKDFRHRNALSEAVLQLQEQGKLTEMKIKWWKEKHGGGACSEEEDKETKPLGVDNVGGVFVLLISGALVAVIFSILEVIFSVKKRSQDCKVFKDELVAELKFIAKCHGNTKTIRQRSSSIESKRSSLSRRMNRSIKSLTPGKNNTKIKNKNKDCLNDLENDT